MSPDPHTAQVTALARQQERTDRQVNQIDTRLRELANRVAALGERPAEGERPPMRAWLLAENNPDAALAVLEDLTGWLAEVYLRYPGAVLPSCWLWHPAVVEELCWLRAAHHDAYHPRTGTPTKAADWHERHRPGVARRIRTGIGTCELALHDPPHQSSPVPLGEAIDRIAHDWTSHRGTPRPTPHDLTTAAQHDNLTNHENSHR